MTPDQRSLRDRIEDPVFQQAVDAIDGGKIGVLHRLLTAHPDLVQRRAHFDDLDYFRSPSLLAFVAENPVRNDRLPPNIVEIAGLLLDAGAAQDIDDLDETLALVASGRVAREAGLQEGLIQLLLQYGARPDQAMNPALMHGEFPAAEALLRGGAGMTLPVAAALGDLPDVVRLLAGSGLTERHLAFAFAAQHGRVAVLRLLLDAGEDPNRHNPQGAHAHSTALHQAVWYGHDEAVRVLLEYGARTDLKDSLWGATPIDWARHAGKASIEKLLTESRR